MHDDGRETGKVQRLCTEIQLFELCSLGTCACKSGRFCTNSDFLARFEAIAEDIPRNPQMFMTEVMDGEDGDSDDGGDEFAEEGYEDEDVWEDE